MSAAIKVEVDVKNGVAEIKSGRNRGWQVGCDSTAQQYLAGNITRSNVVDALALSAAYLDAKEQIAKLKSELKAARRK
jgi:phosphoribosylanthranilate isomerase